MDRIQGHIHENTYQKKLVYFHILPRVTISGGLKTWNFLRYWGSSMWKLQMLIKKNLKFAGVIKKMNVEFPGVLIFWPWLISRGFNTILRNFQWWNIVMPRSSKGKVTNLKIPGFFQRRMSSTRLVPITHSLVENFCKKRKEVRIIHWTLHCFIRAFSDVRVFIPIFKELHIQ